MNRLALPALGSLLAIVVAMAAMHYGAASPEDDTLAAPVPPASTASMTSPPLGTDTAAQVARILARPLFSADRRPAATAAVASGGPTALPRLAAVLVSGRGRAVIFAAAPGGRPVTLAEGGRIGDYVVQSIGAGQATLLGPDGTHVLRPMFDGAPAAGPGPAPVQPSMLDLLRRSTGSP